MTLPSGYNCGAENKFPRRFVFNVRGN